MSFLLKWLGLSIEKPEGLSVRPARSMELELPYDAAYERCLRGLNDALGANVLEADAARGTIEASFGLMFSERIACSLQRVDERTTRITLESRRIAGAELPKGSRVLDRLAEFVREGR